MSQNAIKCSRCGKAIKISQKIGYHHPVATKLRDRIQAITEAIIGLKRDLDAEKRSIERIMARREKNVEDVAGTIAGLCGELDAMAGAFLPHNGDINGR